MVRRIGRRGLALFLAVSVGGLVYGGWRLWRTWNYLTVLKESRQQMRAGRYALAARELTSLLAREPDGDDATYLLGCCAKALGRTQLAFEAWERVRPEAPAAARAALGRATLLVDQGRLADAETFVNEVLADPRIDSFDLRRFMASVYSYEGRREEALRLLETNWDQLRRTGRVGSEQAIDLIRLHITVTGEAPSAKSTESILDRDAQFVRDDDRVWLAKANLAIRRREFLEGERWLDACQSRRPDDVAVWRLRLDWAMAMARVSAAREALKHLPAGNSTAQLHRLAAWFAAQRADREAERRALVNVVKVEPADGPALDRLTELAIAGGQPEFAAELRARRSEIDQLQLQYQKLFHRDQPVRDAAKLARLAQRLGRRFEAKAFLAVAASASPSRADLRDALARAERDNRDARSATLGLTLAEALATRIDSAASASGP